MADLAILLSLKDEASEKLDKFTGRVDDIGKKLAVGLLAAGAAAAGLGVAALKLAGSFDDAYDTIQTQTGATADELAVLQDDFRSVVTTVPADFGSASTAIGLLNATLGLTGEPLRDAAEQMLNLSRITGTDLEASITASTRLFGDWSVAADEQAGTLDRLFRATQVSGIGFTDLSTSLVQFGAPLREAGFSIEESAAMMAKWQKEGVNSELVLGSLRIANGNFARSNIPAREGLEQVIAKIQELGPSAATTMLAMETFGAKAGTDMADVILEGRFAIEDFMAEIDAGEATINGTAAATADWQEKLQLLKNRTLVALEPLLMKVFDAFGRFLDKAAELGHLFQVGLGGGIIGGEFSEIEQAAFDLGATFREDILPALREFATTLSEDILPALLDFGTRVVEIAGPPLTALGDIMLTTVIPAVRELAEVALPILEGALEFLGEHEEIIYAIAAAYAVWRAGMLLMVALQFAQTVAGMTAAFMAMTQAQGLATAAQTLLNISLTANPIGLVILAIAALVAGIIIAVKNWDAITAAVDKFGGMLKDTLMGVLDWVSQYWPEIATLLSGPFLPIVLLATDAFGIRSALVGAVGALMDETVGFFEALPGRLLGLVGTLTDAAAALGNAIRDGITGGIKGTIGVIGDLGAKLLEVLKALINTAIDAVNDAIPNDIGFSVLGQRIEVDLPDNPIPHLASGVRGFGGGLALVGEQGPELVALPRGSDVFTAGETRRMAGGGGIIYNITVNVTQPLGTPQAIGDAVMRAIVDQERRGRISRITR